MAKHIGKFDETIGYNKEDIDTEFYSTHKHILDQKRGGGYWLWKSYFIFITLKSLDDGDYLFYNDSGSFFLSNVNNLINEFEKYDQDIMGFELPLLEKQWTKKELLINMECNADYYTESNQILSGYQLVRKTCFSMEFYREYLNLSTNPVNLDDTCDKDIKQDSTFIEHRHDQSIFSLLYKKYKLRPFNDPSQYGKYPKLYSASKEINLKPNKLYALTSGRLFRYYEYKEPYGIVIYANRNNHPLLHFLKFKAKLVLHFFGIYDGLSYKKQHCRTQKK
ncbi:MAG: hypothetical protein ACI88A_005175 [Paraglaciecola sp.]|jgi:hypothetical protein